MTLHAVVSIIHYYSRAPQIIIAGRKFLSSFSILDIIIFMREIRNATIAVRETVCSRRPPTDGPSVEAQRSLDHLVFVGRHRHRRRLPDGEGIQRERDADVGDNDRERRPGERVDTVLRRSSSLRVDLRFRDFENSSHGRGAQAALGGGVGSSRG